MTNPNNFSTYSYSQFPFMEQISMEGKANFFERQVSAYRLPWVNESEANSDLFSSET